MRIHLPDPDFTTSERARANFRLAFRLALRFVALLWLIQLANRAFGLDLARFGVLPREMAGLAGILFAPLIHDGFDHLIANSLPLVMLGTGMLYLYPNSALRVIPAVYLGSGLAVWLLGRPTLHIGASGLVYGFVSYIFVAGVLRRDTRAIAASLLVYFLYGTLALGVLPFMPGISWETHLAAAAIGLVMAIRLRHTDIPPRKRYAWEDEADDYEADDYKAE